MPGRWVFFADCFPEISGDISHMVVLTLHQFKTKIKSDLNNDRGSRLFVKF